MKPQLKASHIDHLFDKHKGIYERNVQDIIFNNGNSVILEAEKSVDMKHADGLLNGISFKIKSIEGSRDLPIKRALENAKNKNVENLTLYFTREDHFNSYTLNKGYSRFLGLKKGDMKQIWYIVGNKICTFK